MVRRPIILAVEDNAAVAEVIAEVLADHYFDIRIAETAGDALTIAEMERPDAILLDICLPDAAGTSTLDHLHQLRPDVPIIMITANGDEKLARETLKRGAFDYAMKPSKIDHLTHVMEAAL